MEEDARAQSFEAIRPLLVSVDGDDKLRVALEYEAELFVGEHSVAARNGDGRAQAAARATVDALDQMTPRAVAFSLEWCELVEPGPGLPQLAVVLVGVSVATSPMRYAGATVVSGDEALAAAKSVLDAMNRRLGISGL